MTLLPWFGGKAKLADWIIASLPPHQTYVEPFGGAMAVLLRKAPSPVEVYNDVDGGLVNFWRVVRDPALYGDLQRRLALTPYARAEYQAARRTWRDEFDPLERAALWWTMVRQGFSAHASKHAGWSYTVGWSARGMSREVSKYLNAIEGLAAVHERIQRVQIEEGDWRAVMDRYDGPETLFYLDPPYVPATRRAGGYAHELSIEDHRELVARALAIKGGAVLSGYDHPLYAPLVDAGWSVRRREVYCHAAGRTRASGLHGQTRVECLWLSPRRAELLELAL